MGSGRRVRRNPREVIKLGNSITVLERSAVGGDSPVCEIGESSPTGFPSTAGHVKPCGKLGGPSPKAKYYLVTDSVLVP